MSDIMQKMQKAQKIGKTTDTDSANTGDIPAEAATTRDLRSNDEKHTSLLKGVGVARVRTREELMHRTPETPASDQADKAHKRSIAIGLALAAVVVVAVLVALVLLGSNSAL